LIRGLLSLLVASSMAIVAACSSSTADPGSVEASKERGKQLEQADSVNKIAVGKGKAAIQGKNLKARILQNEGSAAGK
jgi:hypothetical protein